MSYAVVTFGCRVNQADSLALEAVLSASWGRRASPDAADVVLVNTCAVTAGAEHSARQAIARVARVNPDARIFATGCYATRDAAALRVLPGVRAVWPNDCKERLLDRGIPGAGLAGPGVRGRTALFLRIQTGCDQPCAYCTIPATRGRPRSLAVARVVAAADLAARQGYGEVVLTGVHAGAYGRDLDPPATLSDLIEALGSCDARLRFRLSSIEPMDCSDRLLAAIERSQRVVPHFHLPLQHGSNEVLARMRRPYRVEQWLRLVGAIRGQWPCAAIGTDVIAGFPGETKDEFEATLGVLRRCPLGYLHAFPYSDRPGTEASSMPAKVPAATIRRRVAALRAIGDERRAAFAAAQVGGVRDAITLRDPTVALTDNYLKVRIPPGHAPNTRLAVRITSAAPLAGAIARKR